MIAVYRYFSNKRALVRGAFLSVEQIFQSGLAELKRDPDADGREVLTKIGERLGTLPPGDASARFDELRRVYPTVYASVQKVRAATLICFSTFAG